MEPSIEMLAKKTLMTTGVIYTGIALIFGAVSVWCFKSIR